MCLVWGAGTVLDTVLGGRYCTTHGTGGQVLYYTSDVQVSGPMGCQVKCSRYNFAYVLVRNPVLIPNQVKNYGFV